MSGPGTLEAVAERAAAALAELRFGPPVDCVYAPLVYAAAPHREYLRRYGQAPKRVLLLGMNPGPFGMVQTGIPFGEVAAVRDWLGIVAPVARPAQEHPKRPVEGFACTRSEVSGRRLWGLLRELSGTPQRLFAAWFVHNYCPLAFVGRSGRNLTPDKLPAAARGPLLAVCDRYLREVAAVLRPEIVVGVGDFAAKVAMRALADQGLRIGRILHPSPASPAANRGWSAAAKRQLVELGVMPVQ